MKTAPYSLIEAKQICTDFQYLAGQSFGDNNGTPISCIAISPFDQMNKKRFIMYYLLFNDAEMALEQDFKGMLFDVLVMAPTLDGQLFHEDLSTWLSKNKPYFEFERETINVNLVNVSQGI